MVATASLILALAQAGSAAAQPQQPPVVRPAVIAPGPTVFVLEGNGPEIRGRLLRLDTSEVVILVDGAERRFDLSRVRRVQKRGDSLKNGAITGAIVGVAASLFAAQGGSGGGGEAVLFTLFATGLYTAIGTGIDAAIQGRTTLYQAPTVTTGIAPPSGKRAALSIRLSW